MKFAKKKLIALLLLALFIAPHSYALEIRIFQKDADVMVHSVVQHYAERLMNDPEGILCQSMTPPYYPLCELAECVSDNCPLSRLHSPDAALARKKFEELVARRLAQQEDVTYVNLGAGELLPDAIIATRAYHLGVKRLTLHAIDTNYKGYISVARVMNRSTVSTLQPSNRAGTGHGHFTQFLAYTAGLYGKDNVKLFIHPTVDAYAAHTHGQPHAIIASDFRDEGICQTLYNTTFHDQCFAATLLAKDRLLIVEKSVAQTGLRYNGVGCTAYTVDPRTLTFDQ